MIPEDGDITLAVSSFKGAAQPGPVPTPTKARVTAAWATQRAKDQAAEFLSQMAQNGMLLYEGHQIDDINFVVKDAPAWELKSMLSWATDMQLYMQGETAVYPAHSHLSIQGGRTRPAPREDTMLEQMLKLYTTYMATGATSPMPHFIGPPGSGKSTVAKQLADLVGVRLHTINVSRISPLELEGVQMPNSDNTRLDLLHATFWTQLQDGDILLFDEFLRGFPEVYNGLLDILTSREVGGLPLKKVFVLGASNSAVAYDGALEDRLLHIPVPDPRNNKAEKGRLMWRIIDTLGLNPEMKKSVEMLSLMDTVVLPTFDLLDSFKSAGTRLNATPPPTAQSVRKLIGQAQLRHVTCMPLRELIDENNRLSQQAGKHQYTFLLSGAKVPAGYESAAKGIRNSPKLTEVQRQNLEINLQLIEMEAAKAAAAPREEDTDAFGF